VRDDVGAVRALERLQRLVEPQATYDVPPLSELSGLGEAKSYCMEVVDSMRAYLAGKISWSECPHGLLVSGPPGTGKTSLMRSLCRELPGVHFIATSYAQWQSQDWAPRRRHFRYPRDVFRGHSASPKYHLHRRV
jgi:cell division protease FtsH